jgi:hypothetical protein
MGNAGGRVGGHISTGRDSAGRDSAGQVPVGRGSADHVPVGPGSTGWACRDGVCGTGGRWSSGGRTGRESVGDRASSGAWLPASMLGAGGAMRDGSGGAVPPGIDRPVGGVDSSAPVSSCGRRFP